MTNPEMVPSLMSVNDTAIYSNSLDRSQDHLFFYIPLKFNFCDFYNKPVFLKYHVLCADNESGKLQFFLFCLFFKVQIKEIDTRTTPQIIRNLHAGGGEGHRTF